MGSLDTNSVIYLLTQDMPNENKAVRNLIERSGTLKVAIPVFFELEYYFRKVGGMSRQLISENLLYIIEHPNLVTRQKLIIATLKDYLEHPKLSFIDCYLANFARETGDSPLHTFDRKLYLQLPDLATKIPLS